MERSALENRSILETVTHKTLDTTLLAFVNTIGID